MSSGSNVGDYRILDFNHALLNRPVSLRLGAIGGYYRSKATDALLEHTVVLTNAGAVPVKETPQDITAAIKRVVEGEKKDGI